MNELINAFLGVLVGTYIAGSIYSLIAMGLSMLWTTVNLVNFGHGAVLVTGAYVAWFFAVATGFPPLMVLAIPVMFLFGLLIDRGAFRIIRYQEDAGLRLILVTLSMAIVLEQTLYVVFSGVYKRIPIILAEGSTTIGTVSIFNHYIVAGLVAILVLVVTYLILTRTITGIAIRSIGQNMQESLAVGVNVERSYSLTVAVGFALAGVAGMLLGSMYSFNPVFGRAPLLIGYIITVLGGLGNIKGTIYASYLVAAIESLTLFLIGGAWRIAIPFMMMIIILIIRPRGLFGIKEEAR
ncbi:MAG: hypothetical protein GTN80_11775 [Nitrososphaeria archaeon]|nr:hypothetical protein [Nitrososphaeria archaeon]NIQ34295.1 hypothetical protein [Nitrososphaeria archaeon]